MVCNVKCAFLCLSFAVCLIDLNRVVRGVVLTEEIKGSGSNRREFISKTGIFGISGVSAAVADGVVEKLKPDQQMGAPAGAVDGYGVRSPFVRDVKTLRQGSVFSARVATPLETSMGIVTPSGLHFERHHAGIPEINPERHQLMIHGLVRNPRVYKLQDLLRFPSVTKFYFVECSGNGREAWKQKPSTETVSESHGLMSTSEWTGVKLSTILNDLGVKESAKWMIAEGGDAARFARSIPLKKALEDTLIVFGQNGEPLRPQQGYPIRLLCPGFEGSCSVKWLSRLELTDEAMHLQTETSKYTDLMVGGKARQFSFIMGVNSVITSPSGGMTLEKGFWEVSGLAWSGHGRIAKVEVSVDQGKSWNFAELGLPVLSKCHTRFRFPWRWDGEPVTLQSRATDEYGHIQPTRQQLIAERGRHSVYHMNAIHSWQVNKRGFLSNIHV